MSAFGELELLGPDPDRLAPARPPAHGPALHPRARAADWWRPLGIWTVARLATLVVFAASAQMAASYGDLLGRRPWPDVSGSGSLTMKLLASWDGAWYLRIARDGYSDVTGDGQALAFFPGYPLAVRLVARATGIGFPLAGLAVSLAAGALTAVLFWELSRRLGGRRFADRALTLFAFFPGSFVFSMTYSEPVMLAAALGCLLLLLDRRWVAAGLCGAVATATRPNAVVLVACCAWAAGAAIRTGAGGAGGDGGKGRREWRAVAAPLLCATGVTAYHAWLWDRTGDPRAWFTVQENLWGERFDLARTAGRAEGTVGQWLSGQPQQLNDLLPTLGVVFAVVALVFMWRWRPPAVLWIYTAGILVLAVTAWNLGPRPRFLMTAFPLVQALAWRLRGSSMTIAVGVSALLLATLAFLSATTTMVVP